LCGALLLAAPASAPAATRHTLGVVDLANGQPSDIARSKDGWSSVRWSADGTAVVAVAHEGGRLVVRRYATSGGSRRVRALDRALDAVLSWDGTMVAERRRTGLVVREVATGSVLLRLPQVARDDLYRNVRTIAWSRDGSRVAYLARERRGRTLRVADVRNSRVVRRIDARRLSVGPDACSPAGDRVVYDASGYGGLMQLDVATGSVRRIGTARILGVAWAPAGERLAVSTFDGVFGTDEQRHLGPALAPDDSVRVLHWSPDGTMLAYIAANFTEVKIELDVVQVLPSPGPPQILVPDRYPYLGELQWSPDGRRIAYVS
jgi:Tol biopolymer transport system component